MVGGSSGGGRKDLNAEINLVPMIDLLSCLVSFLLITAVWSEMGRLDTSQTLAGGGEATEEIAKVTITIFDHGYELNLPEEKGACTIQKSSSGFDENTLRSVLQRTKNTATGKIMIGISSDDALHFSAVVDVMDVCSELGLTNVSLGQIAGSAQGGPPCRGGG